MGYGSDFRFRKEAGSLAPTLVLRRDEEDVRQGTDAGEDADASAWTCMGRHTDGSVPGKETARLAPVRATGDGAYGSESWVSVLSGHQFCRGQKSGIIGRKTSRRTG